MAAALSGPGKGPTHICENSLNKVEFRSGKLSPVVAFIVQPSIAKRSGVETDVVWSSSYSSLKRWNTH
jgi:hypothetical protein